MIQVHVTPLLLALVIAVHLANLAACIAVICFTPSRSTGWQNIEPSWVHWGAYFGGWTFTSLLTCWWLFVGTARSDPERQMWYLFLLVVGFGGLTVACGFQIAYMRCASLRWHGMAIRRRKGRKDVLYDMGQYDSFQHQWDGSYRLRFRNGESLRLDPYARNAEEFTSTVYVSAKRHAYRSWRTSRPVAPSRRWWQLPTFKFNAVSHFCAVVLPILEDYGQAEATLESVSREQSGSKTHSLAKYRALRHASAAVLALNGFAEILANCPPSQLKRFKGDPEGVRKWMGDLVEESLFVDDIADALTKARSENKRPVCVDRDGHILTVDRGRGAGKYGDDEYGDDRIWAVTHAEKRPLITFLAPVAQAWIQELGIRLS